MDREKVIKALERCKVCDMSLIASPEGRKAYLECEYTTGLYCRRDRVISDALKALKEQEDEIQNLRIENHNILIKFHEWAKDQIIKNLD